MKNHFAKKKNRSRNTCAAFEFDSRRLQALMNALPVGVSFSEDTTCERVIGNPALLKQLGVPEGENISASTSQTSAPGLKIRYFHKGKEITGKDLPMQLAVARDAEVPPMEIEARMPDGTSWYHQASGAPVRDENGKMIAVVAVNVDITERRNLEEARKAQEVLKQAKSKADLELVQERMKTNFIADATHELRTPLAIIKGNVELAMQKGSKKIISAEDAFQAINEEVEHLSALLSDLSILTSDGSEFAKKTAFQEVDIVEIVERVAKRCRTLANQKHISVQVKSSGAVLLSGDKEYLQKLFTNLIANAIAYGKEKGKVVVDFKKSASEIKISVTDNGVGISKEHLPYIFDRFYRVNRDHSAGHKGTGLGLSIVKWIAEAHRGKVAVTSSSKGSAFTVTLPLCVERPAEKVLEKGAFDKKVLAKKK